MSNNIPKKLEVKAELIKHLDTAHKMAADNKPSSFIKVMFLEHDIKAVELDAPGSNRDIVEFYDRWLNGN